MLNIAVFLKRDVRRHDLYIKEPCVIILSFVLLNNFISVLNDRSRWKLLDREHVGFVFDLEKVRAIVLNDVEYEH